MSESKTILRVSATYSLLVCVGDEVRRGQLLQQVPDTENPAIAPASGIVESIQFDPAGHEFVIVIAAPL